VIPVNGKRTIQGSLQNSTTTSLPVTASLASSL
jgi:hypothetical protein